METKSIDSNNLKNFGQNIPNAPILIFNPPHGNPGHDCAIAEGAPLNGSQKTKIKDVSLSVPVNVPVVSPEKTTTENQSIKLNPAHGLKDHRCDVAVGEPLNSKPLITPKPTTLPSSESKTLEVKSSLKINPAHGILGHKCEVAVGAPLT